MNGSGGTNVGYYSQSYTPPKQQPSPAPKSTPAPQSSPSQGGGNVGHYVYSNSVQNTPTTVNNNYNSNYGAKPVQSINDIYNAPAISGSAESAISSTPTSSVDISLNIEGLISSQKEIEGAVTNIQQSWQNLLADVKKIEESWAGPDAAVYTEKLYKMKPKMEAAVKALTTTYRTYEKAVNEIQETQNNVKNGII